MNIDQRKFKGLTHISVHCAALAGIYENKVKVKKPEPAPLSDEAVLMLFFMYLLCLWRFQLE